MWLRHGGLLFPLIPHSQDGGCTLGVTSLSVLGPHHLYLDCNPCVIHTERGKLRRPEATPLSISVQLLKAGVSLREKCPIVPTLSSRPMAQRFSLEEKQAINRTLNLLLKELTSLAKVWSSDLRTLSKTVEIVNQRQLGRDWYIFQFEEQKENE